MTDTGAEAVAWPHEIWMAELDEHHNGTGMVVLSQFATVPRWEGDDERDCAFQRYVDADIYESAERYHKERYDALLAENECLRDALWIIATYRKKCHEYDDDTGNERRDFDREDVLLMEWQARSALSRESST